MDSLTQMTLGAAVGEAVLGRKVGNKAILWGAVCGTLPDLDVFIPFGDPVKDFTFHRSFSHSLFVLALLTPVIVWLIRKIHPRESHHHKRWLTLVWVVFATHVLLDCFTIYGTQIFWPVWNYPVGWGTIFIIDPLYTIPLIIGVGAALVMSRERDRGHLLNQAGLVLSSLYLAWSLGAKLYVTQAVEASLAGKSVEYDRLLVSAGPFNTALWRIVLIQAGGQYYEGYYSLLDGSDEVSLERYTTRVELLEELAGHWPVERLKWFTKGFYKVWQWQDFIVVSDLRMGVEPDYVFSFIVGERSNPRIRPLPAEALEPKRDLNRLKEVWQRIWSA